MSSARQWIDRLPILAGPLAMAGFLLPWFRGVGPLSGETYSGFDLVRLSGAFQAADLPATIVTVAGVFRVLFIGFAVAAAWLTMLAPAHRGHPAYAASASYLALTAVVVVVVSLLVSPGALPGPGACLVVMAAIAVTASPSLRFARMWLSRVGSRPSTHAWIGSQPNP